MGSQNQPTLMPPGKMVDVGGFQLHALVCGQGEPTVVFEPALGGYALQYEHMQTAVADFTRAVAYDRAGQGWSEVSSQPRSPKALAGELHMLLSGLGLRPPYVLVGHSFGGLLTRVFAGRYPKEVAGMVLVDAAHVDEYAPFPNVDQFVSRMATAVRLMKAAGRVGLGKPLARMALGPNARTFSKADLQTYLAIASQPKHQETMLTEFAQHRGYFGPQSEVPWKLPDIPLIVVTAGDSISGRAKIGSLTGDQMNVIHQRLQRDLLNLSPRSEQVVIPGATHFSIIARPEHAAQVVAAIRRVVALARVDLAAATRAENGETV